MTTTEELVRSYADSMAGCTDDEVNKLVEECTYILRLMKHSKEHASLVRLQQKIDPKRTLWDTYGGMP